MGKPHSPHTITVAEYRAALAASKEPKYRNQQTMVEGHVFDSKSEAERYKALRLLQIGGEITDLTLQPAWPLVVNGVLIGRYTADFAYTDRRSGRLVVEDVKSEGTRRARDWPLRRKLMLACHGIEVREVLM